MRLKALDLFSGIGGNALALFDMVETIGYCEFDTHAQAVLLSRMEDGLIDKAGIFPDVKTLKASDLPCTPDIIIGGFPCQDISVAGKGEGIREGNRSGLFYQIMRLTDEIQPKFLFLENVPAIRTRGLDIVLRELTQRGYDCRWTMLSAAEVGAKHKRERWFLLAHNNQSRLERSSEKPNGWSEYQRQGCGLRDGHQSICENVADTESRGHSVGMQPRPIGKESIDRWGEKNSRRPTQPDMGRVADGVPFDVDQSLPEYLSCSYWEKEPEDIPRVTQDKEQRVERIKRLGNSVVPLQARIAFFKLMGL